MLFITSVSIVLSGTVMYIVYTSKFYLVPDYRLATISVKGLPQITQTVIVKTIIRPMLVT